jgi:hypothetical protein
MSGYNVYIAEAPATQRNQIPMKCSNGVLRTELICLEIFILKSSTGKYDDS